MSPPTSPEQNMANLNEMAQTIATKTGRTVEAAREQVAFTAMAFAVAVGDEAGAQHFAKLLGVTLKPAKSYSVYFTNHFAHAAETFPTVDAAVAFGKARGFEFSVQEVGGNVVAAWSVFGGLRRY